ncbi:L,D-transpeptidase family protein [Roseibium album]|uniref:Murein L,D-transpeptidase n=1 Tax=Roseibium album TaxID=311410 RepID=A0A0M7AXZ8_9HYPH|nr:L,D-transpeptidase family protein [Roseibium album]CTQ61767.1 murein L,D-transpeptidase [Roseibium album]CTQ75374.1 murein L,D-transpeptidase [Roseibium album]CTQ78484.1 murein L,D-transpeptidase [Roseibium album]
MVLMRSVRRLSARFGLAGAFAFFVFTTPAAVLAQTAASQTDAPPGADLAATEPQTPIAIAIQNAMPADLPTGLQQYYEHRVFAPVWFDQTGVKEDAHLAIAAMAGANEHALNPNNYGPLELAQQTETAKTPEEWARFDLELSRQFLRYATHLSSGRVQPNKINKALNLFPDRPEPKSFFENAEQAVDFSAFLDSLPPQSDNYARLKRRLAQYREKAEAGGFTSVPDGDVLKPGMTDARIPFLRERLIEEDIQIASNHSGDIYDGDLVEAVKTFQDHHGLATDGVIGKNTLARLNVPIQDKLIQMELNMERRRWMRDDLGDFYVFVNLADQNLKVVRDGKTVHTTRVVVGKPYHATPVFSDQLEYVEINPFWNVPYSIATKEYLPKLKQNPSALSSKKIRVFQDDSEIAPTRVAWNSYSGGNFPFRLRQDPGDGNALGRIKFMFPNEFNIYIHDTPSKSLFSRAERAYSHGCIRASNPFALADILLADNNSTAGHWEQIRDSGKRTVIKPRVPVEVHLTYLTAWMNKDGSTHFRKDIYDRDDVLLKALRRAMTDNL